MKKLKLFIFLFLVLFFEKNNTYANDTYKINEVLYNFTLDNSPLKEFPVFNINNDIYISISSMSSFFGFHLAFEQNEKNQIELLNGLDENSEINYAKMVGFVKNLKREVKKSNHTLFYDGKSLPFELLNIEGFNFIKLQEALGFFNLSFKIDDNAKIININTVNDPFDSLSESEISLYQNYFNENSIPIDINSIDNKNLFVENDFNKYNIFLLGESHATSKNFDLQLFFIKYLNKYENIRYILTENGYCDAQLLNLFLDTGDLQIIDNIMKNLKGTFLYSKNASEFYKNIYEYNKNLPDTKKLKFVGIDIQHQIITGVDYLIYISKSIDDMPKIIKDDFILLEKAKNENNFSIYNYNKIKKNINENDEIYKKTYKENYEKFLNAFKNIGQSFECYAGNESDFNSKREKMIIDNFIYQYEKIENEKFIGIMGGFHTKLNGLVDNKKNELNFANYINNNYNKTKNKIGSFTFLYYNSFYMDNKTGESKKITSTTIEKLFFNALKSDFSFIKLDKDSSVFVKDGSTLSQQYLFLINDSKAVVKYN